MESAGKRGLTLVELLVSMVIVAYMLTVLYFCLIQGIRVYKTSEETVPSFREGSMALQQICRDLQIGSYELIYPGLYDLTQEGTHGIVIARYDFMTKEREIVGYFLDERAAQRKESFSQSISPPACDRSSGTIFPG